MGSYMGGMVRFWLLDISEEEGGEIWLWGISWEGERIVLVKRGLSHRFYIQPGEAALDREGVKAILEAPPGVEVEEVEKKKFGRWVEVFEVRCPPAIFSSLVEKAGKIFGEDGLLEDDLRFSNRFLLDHDISPSSWYRGRVEALDREAGEGIDGFYLLEDLEADGEEAPPRLRILGFDILCPPERGEADPGRDPVAAISLASPEGFKDQIVSEGDEADLLRRFVEMVGDLDPDVLVGFGSNETHWSYLLRRAEGNGVHLGVGRLGREPHQSIHGHYSISGRINYDLKDYVGEVAAIQRKSLEELADYLGIGTIPGEDVVDIFWVGRLWRRGDRERKRLLQYSMERAVTSARIFQAISGEVFTLSAITGIPADHVHSTPPGYRLENYLMREAVKSGELIPKARERRGKSYIGGKVLSPKPGLHRDVAVVDFKSMYPSLMLKYNISPDTVVELPYEGRIHPLDGVGIIQDRKGFFGDVLRRLLEERERVRERLKGLEEASPQYNLLDARQKALKVMANAMYGYMGWVGARWYSREGASAVVELGRRAIDATVEKARELGLEIIYGDTDSLFVSYRPELIEALLQWIEEDLGLEAKLEKIYRRILFTEAKKRYAGMTYEGRLEAAGLEMVRGDWCPYARETQKGLLHILLRDGGLEEALEYVRGRIEALRRREVELRDLVIEEGITRNLEDYVARGPHIAVALQLRDEGWRIKRGSVVGYVILAGTGPLYKRALHYSKASLEELDINYYIEKQVLPVCRRILAPLGVKDRVLSTLVKTGRGIGGFL